MGRAGDFAGPGRGRIETVLMMDVSNSRGAEVASEGLCLATER